MTVYVIIIMVAGQQLDRSDLAWQQRLVRVKEESGLSFQALAKRLKTQSSNIFRVHSGTLKMPMGMRARLLDLDAFRSVRAICLALLAEEVATNLTKRHDAYLNENTLKHLRPLPKQVVEALENGDEHAAWNGILDELKAQFGSDQKLAIELGTSRSLVSVVRTVQDKRLPVEVKLRAIDLADFLINDHLLLTLMPTPVIQVVNESIHERLTDENH